MHSDLSVLTSDARLRIGIGYVSDLKLRISPNPIPDTCVQTALRKRRSESLLNGDMDVAFDAQVFFVQ